MRFCPKCGSVMDVVKKKKHTFLVCRKCKRSIKLKEGEKILLKEVIHEPKKEIIVMGKDEGLSELPKTKIMCPECGHMEAYWWMQQTRAADEPPTIFYKCTKCGYTWRVYS